MKRVSKAAAAMVCTLGFVNVAAAAADDRSYLFFDGYVVQHEERIPERATAKGGRLGLGFPLVSSDAGVTGLELGVFSNRIRQKQFSGSHASQFGYMLDLTHTFELGDLDPYVFAGIGQVKESYTTAEDSFLAYEAGVGVQIAPSDNYRLRMSFGAMTVKNDELRSDHDEFVDLRFNIGIMLPLGAATVAAPAPAPVARPVDSDGDGLADNADKCPNEPASTADGCPPPAPVVQTDSDGDGVPDAADSCAGTLAGLKVDAKGCAISTGEQSVVLKGVNFLPNSATLTAQAKSVLDGAAAALTGQPNLKVEIGGYTDSQGKDAANLALSQKRAESVRTYLAGKGIAGNRLSAKGYGEASPIADNNTVEGRAENRRVELKVVK